MSTQSKPAPAATLFPRLRAFKNIVKNDAGQGFYKDLDFAVQRVNYQGDENERHIFQSFRALRPFLIFGSFSAVSCSTIMLTKILKLRPLWSLNRHFKFCLFAGVSTAVLHYHFGTPFEVKHVLTTPNSSYTNLAYAVLDARDDRDDWYTAFNLPPQAPAIERRFFAVPNFQHSGNSGVIAVKPGVFKVPTGPYAQMADQGIPLDGVELTKDELFDEVTMANKLLHSSRLTSPFLRPQGGFDDTAADYLMSQSISSYCALHDIPMPHYFDQFAAFRAEQINVERPVNFLHMYSEDDAKVRGHLPASFQSPNDILAVNQARNKLQHEVDEQARAMWKQQELDKQSKKASGSGGV